MRRLLDDAERVIEESLHQRAQEQFFIRAMLQPILLVVKVWREISDSAVL